jgi:AAA+ superfamily predicted ATPase
MTGVRLSQVGSCEFIGAGVLVYSNTLFRRRLSERVVKKIYTAAVWAGLILLFLVAYQIVNDRRPVQPRPHLRHVPTADGEDPQVEIEYPPNYGSSSSSTLVMWLLIAAGFGAVIYFLRKVGMRGQGSILELRKSRARLASDSARVTFSEVGGCVEAKEILCDLVDFLKNPAHWTRMGARLPRGVLIEGPPGCGKTLLARAVAGETNARFYQISASEFVEMFVGVGAARVRDLFETARKNAPAVVFIDELDAVGRKRGSGVGAAHDEREQTLNQVLVSLDGFESNDRVVVIAATNRADILDAALVRPGRFDRRIRIPPLNREERLQVLKIHTKKKPLAEDLKLETIADKTDGMHGSQLEALVNEAALLAVRRTRKERNGTTRIELSDVLDALKPSESGALTFDKLDSVLVESATQLTQPTGQAHVRLSLVEDTVVEGKVVWANAAFIKIRSASDGVEVIVPKHQVKTIQTLAGTESTDQEDFVPDRWANGEPSVK